MPKLSNEELQNGVALADSKRDFLSMTQVQKNSDFINKDTPPYGVLAGLAIVVGTAGVIVAETVLKGNMKKNIRGLGYGFIALGVAATALNFIFNRKGEKIKEQLAKSTVEAIEAQTQNDISTSDAYTAGLMAVAGDQISQLSDLGIASSTMDLNNKLARTAQAAGNIAKELSDDDLSTGISNLNTLNTNSANLIAGYLS